MDPTLIYFGMLGVVIVVCLMTFAVVAVPTRLCPQCDNRVPMGIRRCKRCQYTFDR